MRALRAGAFVLAVVLWATPALGAFGAQAATDGQASTAVLEPPSDLQATPRCRGRRLEAVRVSWTPTPSTFADGYLLYRINDAGQLEETIRITPRTTSSYDDPDPRANRTYGYVLVATAAQWRSDLVWTVVQTRC